MKENETLSVFVGKIIKCHNDIVEVGDKSIVFSPLQIIGKIISSIPNISRYQLLLQSFHQLDKTKLTLDFVKNAFIEEDKRIELAPKQSRPKQEVNQLARKQPQAKAESKKDEAKPRKCQVQNCK